MRATTVLLACVYAWFVCAVCCVAFGRTPAARLEEILARAEGETGEVSLPTILDLDAWHERNGIRGEERLLVVKQRHSDRVKDLIDAVLSPPGRRADWLIERAHVAASKGAPRPDLLRYWKLIAGLPLNDSSLAALKMVRAYEIQIREDAAFQRKSAAELAEMSPASRAGYWIALLRDLRPGGEYVSQGEVFNFPDHFTESIENPWPPYAVSRLGLDAVPPLIAHLDDPGPTRAWFQPPCYFGMDYYHFELLTVGEACAQILRRITGKDFLENSPNLSTRDREERSIRAKKLAEAWWAPLSGLTREDQHLALMADDFLADLVRGLVRDLHRIDGHGAQALDSLLDKGPAVVPALTYMANGNEGPLPASELVNLVGVIELEAHLLKHNDVWFRCEDGTAYRRMQNEKCTFDGKTVWKLTDTFVGIHEKKPYRETFVAYCDRSLRLRPLFVTCYADGNLPRLGETKFEYEAHIYGGTGRVTKIHVENADQKLTETLEQQFGPDSLRSDITPFGDFLWPLAGPRVLGVGNGWCFVASGSSGLWVPLSPPQSSDWNYCGRRARQRGGESIQLDRWGVGALDQENNLVETYDGVFTVTNGEYTFTGTRWIAATEDVARKGIDDGK